MKFCMAKESITPQEAVVMGGFASRTGESAGVHDDIYARAALMQANEALLIISLDAVSGDRRFVDGIKEGLREQFGLRSDQILINFSHAHSSIDLSGPPPDLRNRRYKPGMEKWPEDGAEIRLSQEERSFFLARDVIAGLVAYCFSHLQGGRLLLGWGRSDMAVSRRMMTERGGEWRPNPDAEIDKDVCVLKLLDANDAVGGILFSFGCHPTALSWDNLLLSSEFPGAACRYLEQALNISGASEAFPR